MQSNIERAKIFLSFDALKGFREYLQAQERVVVPKKELSPDSEYELNWKVRLIEVGKMIKVIYYNQGQYVSLEGMVTAIDLENKKIVKIVDKMVCFSDIIEIDIK